MAESPPKQDQLREKAIREAEVLYKARKYKQSLAVFEKSDATFPWIVDQLYAKRERLVAMNLHRLKRYDESEIANLRAYEVDPRLIDAIYDSACAASLGKHAESAVLYLRVLWNSLREQPTELARYAAAAARDKDLENAARLPEFKTTLEEFASGKLHPSRPFLTDPPIYMLVGENVDSGYSSHGLMAMKMCPKMPERDGVFLAAPEKVVMRRPTGANPVLNLRLPVCFSHMISSGRIRETKKKNSKASFEMRISVRHEGDPKVYSGRYNASLNSQDLRTGRILEDPALEPSEAGGVSADQADFSTGGREITDVVWHIPGLGESSLGKPEIRMPGVYHIVLHSDAQQSNEVRVVVEMEK